MSSPLFVKIATAFLLAGLIHGAAPAAVLYATGFETDDSAAFITRTTGNAELLWTYDYSTFVPTLGLSTPASITQAPSTPTGITTTRGLRIRANHLSPTTFVEGAATIFPNAGVGLSRYTIQFDAFLCYNGANATQYMTIGGHSDASLATAQYAAPFTGFFVSFSGDGQGGASADVLYYQGNGGTVYGGANTIGLPAGGPPFYGTWNEVPNLFGKLDPTGTIPNENRDYLGTDWDAFLTTPPFLTPNKLGKTWMTVTMEVVGQNVKITLDPDGNAALGGPAGPVVVADFVLPETAPTSGYPMVGYWDPFESVETVEGNDLFLLIDNFVLSDTATSSAKTTDGWVRYE